MLAIYGRANSLNVRKVLWLCDEIGLAYRREDWGRGFRPLDDPEYRRLNAFSLIPTIVDHGFVLRESNTILRYLAAKHGRDDLYPTDLQRRAEVEVWMDWGACDLYAGCRVVFLGQVVKARPYDSEEQLSYHLALWSEQMRRLEAWLATGGPYVTGSAFTLGDIQIGLLVHRWFALDIVRPDLPAIAAYYARLGERPPFRAHGCNGMP